jgi:hypothetical protein
MTCRANGLYLRLARNGANYASAAWSYSSNAAASVCAQSSRKALLARDCAAIVPFDRMSFSRAAIDQSERYAYGHVAPQKSLEQV